MRVKKAKFCTMCPTAIWALFRAGKKKGVFSKGTVKSGSLAFNVEVTTAHGLSINGTGKKILKSMENERHVVNIPPLFKGQNYNYWKQRIIAFFDAYILTCGM
ncbi:hypothetical protein CR513_16562, partial [Mucuna pruriens]